MSSLDDDCDGMNIKKSRPRDERFIVPCLRVSWMIWRWTSVSSKACLSFFALAAERRVHKYNCRHKTSSIPHYVYGVLRVDLLGTV